MLKVFLIIFGALTLIGGIYTVKSTNHYVEKQHDKAIKKNQFSSYSLIYGYYQGVVIAVLGVGLLIAGIFIK